MELKVPSDPRTSTLFTVVFANGNAMVTGTSQYPAALGS
jgi:hypothetical protein